MLSEVMHRMKELAEERDAVLEALGPWKKEYDSIVGAIRNLRQVAEGFAQLRELQERDLAHKAQSVRACAGPCGCSGHLENGKG